MSYLNIAKLLYNNYYIIDIGCSNNTCNSSHELKPIYLALRWNVGFPSELNKSPLSNVFIVLCESKATFLSSTLWQSSLDQVIFILKSC